MIGKIFLIKFMSVAIHKFGKGNKLGIKPIFNVSFLFLEFNPY